MCTFHETGVDDVLQSEMTASPVSVLFPNIVYDAPSHPARDQNKTRTPPDGDAGSLAPPVPGLHLKPVTHIHNTGNRVVIAFESPGHDFDLKVFRIGRRQFHAKFQHG